MDEKLRNQIVERLLADEKATHETIKLVDAACVGDGALDAALADLANAPRPEAPASRKDAGATPEPPGAYLHRLQVAGFRGVASAVQLELEPGPGLTLIVGRNGSGKSSLAEGLETVLLGESGRWSKRRSALWKEGWRNLHGGDGARLEARFLVEGSKPVTVRRRWKADDELEAAALEVVGTDGSKQSLTDLGWEQALRQFRPFLSYPELGALVDEPSKAFDELFSLLGLEEINAARDRLAERRKRLETPKKQLVEEKKALVALLAKLDDPRAARCREALEGTKPDLETLESVALGEAAGEGDDGRIALLRKLSTLRTPGLAELETAAGALRAAAAAVDALADESLEAHGALADVLARALAYLEKAPDACPVCERPMSPELVATARGRLEGSRRLGEQLRAARGELARCLERTKVLFAGLDGAAVLEAGEVELPLDAAVALGVFASFPDGASAIAEHVEEKGLALVAAVEALRDRARAALDEKEGAFRPVRAKLLAWVAAAREVRARESVLKALSGAESWMKGAEGSLRSERFAPVAAKVRDTWAALGQTGHVVLEDVALAGTANRRHLDFVVKVDGAAGKAVAVMSQGELNALALSLFLPRMTLPESPFRFLVIDDPVQAMDPHKVDGLANVLAQTARSRQVIVLTHDARLVEAVRRLRIPATVLEVSRRAQSRVEVRRVGGPVESYLDDARAMVAAEAEVGKDVVRRVVPGLCRAALEAACLETVRRKRLGRGDDHADVERAIEDAKAVMELLALALFDDATKGGDVYKAVANRAGQPAVDALKACKAGAHGGFTGDSRELVDRTRDLATSLRSMA